MGTAHQSELVRGSSSLYEALAAGTVGLCALLFAVAFGALVEFFRITDPVAGVQVVTLIGGLLTLVGLEVIGFGLASRYDYVETRPRRSAGLVAALCFTGLYFVVGGLVGSQTLGLDTFGWLLFALAVAGLAFAVTGLTREDVGSTVPAGALVAVAGLAFLLGVVGGEWAWSPADFPSDQQVTFFATTVVPVTAMFASLVAGWAAAKAYGGFGARGRHAGAYLLIYLNALAIIAVLVVLVAYTVVKGLPVAARGFAVGHNVGPPTTFQFALNVPFVDVTLFDVAFTVVWPVSWPFVMQGVSIFNDVNGVFPAIVGTFWLVVGAVAVAVPLGVGSAIFLTEYAERGRFTQVVEIATNGLWSTPSIVFGLFGYTFLIGRLSQGKSLLVGMLTLGFMLLPLVVITSREAMIAVPDEYRDASAALGVSKWQTIRSVVIPAALPGVVTGVILGVGRIAGETAPILLTMASSPDLSDGEAVDVIGGFQFTGTPPFVENPALMDATSALPYQLFALIQAGVGSFQIEDPTTFGWGTALVLLVVVLGFYAVGITTRYYFRRKLTHE